MNLRICHIITQLELGGAQRNTLYTTTHLDKHRFTPSLLCGRGGMLDAEAAAGPWPDPFVSHLVRPVRPWSDFWAVVDLYKILRRDKPHIVHTHSSKAGIVGRLAAYLAGVPVILHTFHGFGFTPGQHVLVRKLYVTLEKFCSALSTHLIFVSEDNQREADTLGILKGKPYSLIRSGISMSPQPEGERLPGSGWTVISVGNFKPQKNPLDLIRVAQEVCAKDPSIQFVLIGDGQLRGQAEQEVKAQGLTQRVHFLGWRQDARQFTAQADAFLLTSLWEGLPRALVEAFAERKPAVGYGVNGVRDILKDGENGFMITPGDTATAAEKILWLKNHTIDARRMGEAGRRVVEVEFDIDRMVRQQESLYESLYAAVPLKEHYEKVWNAPVSS